MCCVWYGQGAAPLCVLVSYCQVLHLFVFWCHIIRCCTSVCCVWYSHGAASPCITHCPGTAPSYVLNSECYTCVWHCYSMSYCLSDTPLCAVCHIVRMLHLFVCCVLHCHLCTLSWDWKFGWEIYTERHDSKFMCMLFSVIIFLTILVLVIQHILLVLIINLNCRNSSNDFFFKTDGLFLSSNASVAASPGERASGVWH